MIIGFIGYGGSGKSTATSYLRNRHGWVTPHIGWPLKRMAHVLLDECGYSPEEAHSYIDGDKKRDVIPFLGKSGTELQQYLGTEFGRRLIREDLWLDLWCR